MGVLHSPESPYAKEMAKWEALPTMGFPNAARPYAYRPYPTQMYRAGLNSADQIVVLESQRADDDTAQRNLESRGFVAGGAGAAVDAFERQQVEIARLAANRAYQERGMSAAARAEAAAADEATDAHLPVIPEQPRRPRGRPKKTETA